MMRPAKKQKLERRAGEWEPADAVYVDPNALVGKQLRVFWPKDGRYFPGRIAKYISNTFQHEISYDDGDQETLILVTEKIQLYAECLQSLPAPSPAHLAALARHLDSLADRLEEKCVNQRTARGRTVLKEEERQQLEALRRRAADVRNARDEQQRRQDQQGVDTSKQECSSLSDLQHRVSEGAQPTGRCPSVIWLGKASRIATPSKAAATKLANGTKCMDSGTHELAEANDNDVRVPQSWRRSGQNTQPNHLQPVELGPQPGPKSSPSNALLRVCSPASAKRRQFALRQQRPQQPIPLIGDFGVDGPAAQDCIQGTSSAPAEASQQSKSKTGAPPLSKQGNPTQKNQQQPSGPELVTVNGSWRPQGARTCGDVGRLYIPRAWPCLPALVPTAVTAGMLKPTLGATASMDPLSQQQHAAQGSLAGSIGQSVDVEDSSLPALSKPQALATPSIALPKGAVANGGHKEVSHDPHTNELRQGADELREAYRHFRRHCSGFKQYHELQVALWLPPEQLVGREVRVLWPDEGAWFCGRITCYEVDTGTHTVEYDDGDVEHLQLAAEEVRLQVVPGEAEVDLAPQPPAELLGVADKLATAAERARQRACALRGHRGKEQRHDETGAVMQAANEGGDAGVDPEELLAKAERWSTRAAQLRSLAAIVLQDAIGTGKPATFTQRQRSRARIAPGNIAARTPEPNGATDDVLPDGTPAGVDRVIIQPKCAQAGATSAAEQLPRQACGNVAGSEYAAGCINGTAVGGNAGAGYAPQQAPDWSSMQVLRPGEVVWAQVRRSAPWPAIIVTREEAERDGLAVSRLALSSVAMGQVAFVRFFGDYTVYSLPAVGAGQRIPDRGAVLPFLAGLDLGWHMRGIRAGAQAISAHSQRFMRAMFELRTYMREGELPRGMIPANNDGDDDDDEKEFDNSAEPGIVAAAAAIPQPEAAHTATARTGGSGCNIRVPSPRTIEALDVSLPLVLGHKLQVLQLGRVVWLSRWFHDEKYIYPLGYSAVRLMTSAASGGREVRHVMEVVASEDGVRPIFRITPDGGGPVSADTATRAMRALFEGDARTSGRALTRTGADLFGLSNPRVAALLRALPGAARCELFANWPDQEKPLMPPLTPYEEQQRRALYARGLRLLPGIEQLKQSKAGMCFECEVCGEDEESVDDPKLECDMCRCVVHSRCYGVEQPQHGALWLCDVCKLHAAGLPAECAPPCALCPVAGGPMKLTDTGSYVHMLCAMWTPGVTFGDPVALEPVEGVGKAIHNRSSLRCLLCKQAYGACIQCAGHDRCYKAFHPMCAREAGLAMCELRQGWGRRQGQTARPSAPPASTGTSLHQAAATQPAGGTKGTRNGGSDEGSAKVPDGKDLQMHASTVGQPSTSADRTGKDRTPPVIQAATDAVIAPHEGAVAAARSTAAGAPSNSQRSGRCRGRPRSSSHTARAAALDRTACRGGVSLGNGVSLLCFCPNHEKLVLHQPRFRAYYPGGGFANRRAEITREQLRARREALLQEHELKQPSQPPGQQPMSVQQLRESDSVHRPQPQDAACPSSSGRSVEQATGRAMSFAAWRGRGHRAPEAIAIAREKRNFVQQLPYLIHGLRQHDAHTLSAVCGTATTGASRDAVHPSDCKESVGPATDILSGRMRVPDGAGSNGAPGVATSSLPPALAAAAMQAGARSLAERYAAMQCSVGRRVAVGKSAIHGWGAFAKVPHKRGDMLIEYVGELIRPAVSDVREKRDYDTLVGCGTYIFNLNEHEHIDATRAGNMAHLLNHSCEPNCYSRTITLQDPATGATTDHVIITAKRDIAAWEELTYDYRFNSAEDLPCNCGATTCRLLVNWPEQPQYDASSEDDEGALEDGLVTGEPSSDK